MDTIANGICSHCSESFLLIIERSIVSALTIESTVEFGFNFIKSV